MRSNLLPTLYGNNNRSSSTNSSLDPRSLESYLLDEIFFSVFTKSDCTGVNTTSSYLQPIYNETCNRLFSSSQYIYSCTNSFQAEVCIWVNFKHHIFSIFLLNFFLLSWECENLANLPRRKLCVSGFFCSRGVVHLVTARRIKQRQFNAQSRLFKGPLITALPIVN